MQHFLRTTRWLSAGSLTLPVGSNCRVRRWCGPDAELFSEQVRKRSVFARSGGLRDFYYQRAMALQDATVVEIYGGGLDATEVLAANAELAEDVVIASFVLVGGRREFIRRVIGRPSAHLDIHLSRVGGNTRVTSTSEVARDAPGLAIDAKAVARYRRAGFGALYDFATSNVEVASRIRVALGWLIESRTDVSAGSALVKTSTALESLLVIGKEPPTRALAERAAFLLTDDPETREHVSKAAHRFYGIRGNIVHGKPVSSTLPVEPALEFGDRAVVLLSLVMATQVPTWRTAADVQGYADRTRWGYPPTCKRPWSVRQLHDALARINT